MLREKTLVPFSVFSSKCRSNIAVGSAVEVTSILLLHVLCTSGNFP